MNDDLINEYAGALNVDKDVIYERLKGREEAPAEYLQNYPLKTWKLSSKGSSDNWKKRMYRSKDSNVRSTCCWESLMLVKVRPVKLSRWGWVKCPKISRNF